MPKPMVKKGMRGWSQPLCAKPGSERSEPWTPTPKTTKSPGTTTNEATSSLLPGGRMEDLSTQCGLINSPRISECSGPQVRTEGSVRRAKEGERNANEKGMENYITFRLVIGP